MDANITFPILRSYYVTWSELKEEARKGSKVLFWKKWLKQLDVMNGGGQWVRPQNEIFSLEVRA